MPTVKKISIDFGEDHMVADMSLSDGDEVRVVAIIDQESNTHWVSEAKSKSEQAEKFAEKNAKAIFNAMLSLATE